MSGYWHYSILVHKLCQSKLVQIRHFENFQYFKNMFALDLVLVKSPQTYLFSYSTIGFSFKELPTKLMIEMGKPKTPLCCTPSIHRPLKLNPSTLHGY